MAATIITHGVGAGERTRTVDPLLGKHCPPGWPSATLSITAESTKEREMRRVMSNRSGIAAYLKDMTLNANLELGDLGTCRRW